MKTFQRVFWAVLMLTAVTAQNLHRHASHEGGLAPEHVDCVVCAWSQRGDLPWISSGGCSAGVRFLAIGIVHGVRSSFPRPAHASSLSRAPPSL